MGFDFSGWVGLIMIQLDGVPVMRFCMFPELVGFDQVKVCL